MSDDADALTDFQVEVARIFFGLRASKGYLAAGGAALLASELIDRPTQDIDLFASAPLRSVREARASLVRALESRGCHIDVIRDSATFSRLIVVRGAEEVLIDLAIDSPPVATPTVTLLGPTLAPLELAGRKLLALFGRAEARDFADVYALARLFGKEALIEQAAAIDAGFELSVLAQMLGTMSRFVDDEITLGDEVAAARSFFRSWAAELDSGAG